MSLTDKYKSALNDDFKNHYEKYSIYETLFPTKFGQYFLYEKFKYDGRKLSYPKLAIHINSIPCDQTIEMEWVNYRRTIEDNLSPYEKTEIERLIIWSDSILIYGFWDKMPSWKELKIAYEKTWWYHRNMCELRDIKLNGLLE